MVMLLVYVPGRMVLGHSRMLGPDCSWARGPKLCVNFYLYLCYVDMLVVGFYLET